MSWIFAFISIVFLATLVMVQRRFARVSGQVDRGLDLADGWRQISERLLGFTEFVRGEAPDLVDRYRNLPDEEKERWVEQAKSR